MKKYTITWSKTYYANGTKTIKANSPEEAKQKADEQIGDWSGSMQYCSDDNQIEIEEET